MEQSQKFIDALLTILGDIEAINHDDVAELKREFERSEADYLEDYLIDEDIVDKENILKALQLYYNVQAIDVMGEIIDHELLVKFPKEVLLNNCCIPFRQDGLILFMIASNPSDENLDAVLGEYVSYDFEYFVGIPRHIDMMIKDFYQDNLYHEQDEYETNLEHAEGDRELVITEADAFGEINDRITREHAANHDGYPLNYDEEGLDDFNDDADLIEDEGSDDKEE